MALRLNLASHPFKNRRPWLFGVIIVVLVSAVLSWSFAERGRSFARQAEAMAALVQRQENEIRNLRQQIPPPVRADQLTPVEREAIKMAGVLIERRVFPWSRLLNDIEDGLGSDTRVTTITVSPQVNTPADATNPGRAPVQVGMTIVGKTLEDVHNLIGRFQKSGHFVNFRPRKQSTLEATGEIEYEVEATYFPAVEQ
jgi:hypothetical protein